MKKELVGSSKFLSMVLRHKPQSIGISLDEEGWVDVNELLSRATTFLEDKGKPALSKEDLDEIVETNNKKRFEYSEDGWNIRARQGHSVEVDLKYKSKTPPVELFHGTAEKFVPAIRKKGINRQKRHHVHLSADYDTAVNVGKRHGKVFVLRVDCKAMFADGFDFFETENNVWLVDEVPTKFIDFNYKHKSQKGQKG